MDVGTPGLRAAEQQDRREANAGFMSGFRVDGDDGSARIEAAVDARTQHRPVVRLCDARARIHIDRGVAKQSALVDDTSKLGLAPHWRASRCRRINVSRTRAPADQLSAKLPACPQTVVSAWEVVSGASSTSGPPGLKTS